MKYLAQRMSAYAPHMLRGPIQEWIPQMIFDADVVYNYHDDGRSVRHQIARLFEKLIED
jgi:hypothetical protein